MNMILNILIVVIALEHLYFMYFEMFAWETIGKKTFKSLPEHLFKPTKGLAANQGLYNGFLAAGLIWSLFTKMYTISNNRIRSLKKDCHGVNGMASPKQPQDLTTSKNAE